MVGADGGAPGRGGGRVVTDVAQAVEPLLIDAPGVYDIPAEAYHGDPVVGGSLSSTGARKLLPPSCPALFRHSLEKPDPPKKAWDLGHAAHKLVLGVGPELVKVEGDGKLGPEVWNTAAVKAEANAVRRRGAVPLKPSEYEQVRAMADALRTHPWAGKLFAPGTGEPERVLVWQEKATITNPDLAGEGATETVTVWCRAQVDWLRHPLPGYRYLLPDYKTTGAKYGASPSKVGRTISDLGYYIQIGFYLRGVRALNLGGQDATGLLVIQETAEPYLVTVAQPDHTAMRLAEIRIREAIDLYAQCIATGRWQGYSDDVVIAELPPWETRELDGAVW